MATQSTGPRQQATRLPLATGALLLLAACAPAWAGAWQPLKGLVTEAAGEMRFEDVSISIVHFAPGWKCARQGQPNVALVERCTETAESWTLTGRFQPRDTPTPFAFRQEMRRTGANAFAYRATVSHPEGIPTNTLALALRVPVGVYEGRQFLLDGKPVDLVPKEFEKGAQWTGVRRVGIPTSRGLLTVEGTFTVMIQDGRGTGHPFFRVRLMFDPCKGTIRDASLTAAMSLRQPEATPLDIRPVANMGFRDETEGDRMGGWTDQGDNDIRMLPTGPVRFATIPFRIVEPETNGGKSCWCSPVRTATTSRAKRACGWRRGHSRACTCSTPRPGPPGRTSRSAMS